MGATITPLTVGRDSNAVSGAMQQEPKHPMCALEPAELRTIAVNILRVLSPDVEAGDLGAGIGFGTLESHFANGLLGNSRSIINARKSGRLRRGSRADSFR
jgi:hypothetical protein